jgi:ATP-dependent helicase/nuclease subunit A
VRETPDSRLDIAKQVLEELVSRRRLESPSALLELADRLTGYTAVISNLPGAKRREADWRGFLELIRDLERGYEDVFTVVRWLRQLREAGAEIPRPPLEPGDAVSLVTIHSAKGLEWPVVVMPDLARGVPSSFGAVVFDPGLGVAVDFGEEGGKPALYRLIVDRKVRAQREETRRVFYVAPTRARDHLILTSTERQTERFCGLNVLRPGLERAEITFTPVLFNLQDSRPPELPAPSPAVPPRLLIEPADLAHARS